MKVLFVCKANVGRSQMAETFFNNLVKKQSAISAGLNPREWKGKKINTAQKVISCTNEIGFDLTNKISKEISKEMVDNTDKIIVIGEKNNWPEYLINNYKVEFWDIEDAAGKDLDFHRRTRDKIMTKVKELIIKLKD